MLIIASIQGKAKKQNKQNTDTTSTTTKKQQNLLNQFKVKHRKKKKQKKTQSIGENLFFLNTHKENTENIGVVPLKKYENYDKINSPRII